MHRMKQKIFSTKWTPLKIIGAVLAGIILAVIFALIFGFVTQFLWNRLMPEIFGLPEITYFQAFGLIILSRILIGLPGHHDREDSDHHHLFKDACGQESRQKFHEFWKEKGKEEFEKYLRDKQQSGVSDSNELIAENDSENKQ